MSSGYDTPMDANQENRRPGSSHVRMMPERLETETSRTVKQLFLKYDMDGLCNITATLVGDQRKTTFTLTPKGRKVVLFSLEKFVWKHPNREDIPLEELAAQMPKFIKEMWFLCQHEAEIPEEMQDIDIFMAKWQEKEVEKTLAYLAETISANLSFPKIF